MDNSMLEWKLTVEILESINLHVDHVGVANGARRVGFLFRLISASFNRFVTGQLGQIGIALRSKRSFGISNQATAKVHDVLGCGENFVEARLGDIQACIDASLGETDARAYARLGGIDAAAQSCFSRIEARLGGVNAGIETRLGETSNRVHWIRESLQHLLTPTLAMCRPTAIVAQLAKLPGRFVS